MEVKYDAARIELSLLLELFFKTIDPTAVNRQGNDIGTQYRTGIYYTAEEQLPVIRKVLTEIARHYDKPIAVEVSPLHNFYPAEEYHQNYLVQNPGGYCHIGTNLFEVAKQANR